MSDLLYTQEDIDEWVRTCDELQDRIYEQKVEIAQLTEERENMQDEIFALEDARLQATKDTAQEVLEQFIIKLIDSRLVGSNDDMYYELLEVKDYLLKEKYGVEVE